MKRTLWIIRQISIVAVVVSISACTARFNGLSSNGTASNASRSATSLSNTIKNNAVELGLNKFDLVNQYEGKASGSDGSEGHLAVEKAMGRKAIIDAKNVGATFLRVRVMGFMPVYWGESGDLDLWIKNPDAYWANMDQMMNDLVSNGMRIVPDFASLNQCPAMSPNQETVADLVTNVTSWSFQNCLQPYIEQFITRYKNNPAIIFYEITNEMNLTADMDVVTRCQKDHPTDTAHWCETQGNFTTDQMDTFMATVTDLIYGLDPSRPISSGNGFPRVNAENLRANPEWISGINSSLSTALDTQAQFVTNLSDINLSGASDYNPAMSLVSVHDYGSLGDNRFGNTAPQLLAWLNSVVTGTLHKKLYVGEYGNYDASEPNTPSTPGYQILDAINSLQIPYSSAWILEFYQSNLTTVPSQFHLEEGFSDGFFTHLQSVSAQLGDWMPPQSGTADTTPPQVVLLNPLDTNTVSVNQMIYAMASDNSGTVTRVDFSLDGQVITSISTPPYMTTVNTAQWPSGSHFLAATAYDPSGNHASYTIAITVNSTTTGSGTATPTPTPTPMPSLTLTVNGQTPSSVSAPLVANVGDSLAFNWNAINATKVSSVISYLSPSSADHCVNYMGEPWVAATMTGSPTAVMLACQAGFTYGLTVTATNSMNQAVSKTIYVQVNTSPIITSATYGGVANSDAFVNLTGANFQTSGNTAIYNCGSGWVNASVGVQDATFIQISFPATTAARSCSVQVTSGGEQTNAVSNINVPADAAAGPDITNIQEGGTAGMQTYLNIYGTGFQSSGNTAMYNCGSGWSAASAAGPSGQNNTFVQINFPSALPGAGTRTCQVYVSAFGTQSNIYTVTGVP